MFWDSLIQRKIASLLRPWLVEEPDWKVKIGVIHSIFVARNLTFRNSVLNELLDDGFCLVVKDVTVEEVSVRVAHWSSTAFAVDVRGVRVTVSAKERDDVRASSNRTASTDSCIRNKKKLLAKIDPEGSAFHENMEKLIALTPSRSRLKTSLVNLILRKSCLVVHDVHLKVKLPFLDEELVLVGDIVGLKAECQHVRHGCLSADLIASLFQPVRDSSIEIAATAIEIRIEGKDLFRSVFSSMEPCIGIWLKDLCILDLMLFSSEIIFQFSPTEIHILTKISNLNPVVSSHSRSGHKLWQLARSRVLQNMFSRRYVLYQVVNAALLSVRLVKVYQCFLMLVGCRADELSQRVVIKMAQRGKFFRSANKQWTLICQIEKELHPEAIAWARRVARSRLMLGSETTEGSSMLPGLCQHFHKLFFILLVSWRWMFKILEYLLAIFLQKQSDDTRLMGHASGEDYTFLSRTSLNLCNVSIAVLPLDPFQFPYPGKTTNQKISHFDLQSFYLRVKGILFVYVDGICERHVSCSFGLLQVASTPAFEDSGNPAGFTRKSIAPEEFWRGRSGNSRDIAWGQSAPIFFCPKASDMRHEDGDGSNDVPFLEKRSDEMKSSWRQLCSRFQENDLLISGYPFLFFDSHSFWVHPGISCPGSGTWKCSLGIGKLNFSFKYLELLSAAVILRQMQNFLHRPSGGGSNTVLVNSLLADQHFKRIQHPDRSNYDVEKVKMILLNLLPEYTIELDVLIAGPHVNLLGLNGEDISSDADQESFDMVFDFHNISIVVKPDLEILNTEDNCIDMDSLILEDSGELSNSGLDQVKYVSRGKFSLGYNLKFDGLSVYIMSSKENQKIQVLLLKPVSMLMSSLREYAYFFGASTVVLSAASRVCSDGGFVYFCVDELSMALQVFQRLYISAVTYTFGTSNANTTIGDSASAKTELFRSKPETEDQKSNGDEGDGRESVSARIMVTGAFQVKPLHVLLHGSESSNQGNLLLSPSASYSRNLFVQEFPCTGIWLSTSKISGELSLVKDKAKMDVALSGFRAAIFQFKNDDKSQGQFQDEKSVLLALDCLYEISLSNCEVSLLVCFLEDLSLADTGEASGRLNRSMVNCDQTRGSPISRSFLEKENRSTMPNLATAQWLLINVTFDLIFMGSSCVKNSFVGSYPTTVFFSISEGGDFQIFCFRIQDCCIIIEPTVLATAVWCFRSYHNRIKNLFIVGKYETNYTKSAELGGSCVSAEYCAEGNEHLISHVDSSVRSGKVENLAVDISHLSIILLSFDKNLGRVQKLTGKVDLCLNIWPENERKKILFNMPALQVLSEVRNVNRETKDFRNQSPKLSSRLSSHLSLDYTDSDFISTVPDHASSSSPVFGLKPSPEDSVNHISEEIKGNCILKRLSALVSAQKLEGCDNCHGDFNQGWDGSGSLSGFDINLSLSEIQMIMEAFEFLAEVLSMGMSDNVKKKQLLSSTPESENEAEAFVPDGSIVAIQDVHHHMYITVVNEENKYRLVGSIHYSLLGEKALFRVKIKKQRRWNFQSSWFTLESLYARNEREEPLRLDYCSGSGFVGISSTTDSDGALWKFVSCDPESSDSDINLEPFSQLCRNTFHLVNKKNDCGVALVDGIPEFVRKPGHPFKLKRVRSSALARDTAMLDTQPEGTHGSYFLKGSIYSPGAVPCIRLTVDYATVTIVHELSNPINRFSLLQGCIKNLDVAVQILPHIIRVMSTSTSLINYFDTHTIHWRELVHPMETSFFYRMKFCSQDVETSDHGAPASLHVGMKRVDISLTELSLDILLYIIGNLDLAGPFAVKSSSIMANHCRVENKSGVNLHCHFDDSQDARVSRKQSVLFFPRQVIDQPLEASYVSFKLENVGLLSTSVKLPLYETQTCAWRTRIVSPQDSRTHPGPFIVCDISKTVEEGLSVVVSPLLRIHNETEFPIELHFQRPEQAESEYASLCLESGNTIDDCMAAFDAINLSGTKKKALMSIAVGNFLFAFRPDLKGKYSSDSNFSIDMSDNINGSKAIRLSGIIEKLSYKVRRAFTAESSKCSFSVACCSVRSGKVHVTDMHFLVQSIERKVPVLNPNIQGEAKDSLVALREQKEIFLLPTVRVSNLLQLDVHVYLTESEGVSCIGNQATVPSGSTVELYANPATICFTVTLTTINSSCKPVKSGDWIKKLNKQKDGIQFLDVDLEFCSKKYFASLRLNRGDRGTLEAVIYTSYTLKNETEFPLFCFTPSQKPKSRDEIENYGADMPPYLGCFMPPKSIRSWFMKSNKLCLKLLDQVAPESIIDLNSLSGLTEISLFKEAGHGLKHLIKLGVSVGPLRTEMSFPSQIVSMVPRYFVSNDTDEKIFVRQCYLEDDLEGSSIASKQRISLLLTDVSRNRRQIGVFEKLFWKHRVANDDSSMFVQFKIDHWGSVWSGPVCVSSLGRFFVKFKSSSEPDHPQSNVSRSEKSAWEFAAVHVVEEASSLVLHFTRTSDEKLPYRIENHLSEAFITYYQKDTYEPEILAPGGSVGYAWDDLTCPHKLVVRINGADAFREINLDKLRGWRPFIRARNYRGLEHSYPLGSRTEDLRLINQDQTTTIDLVKIGYELYTDGPTRVLRICRSPDTLSGRRVSRSSTKIQLRVSSFTIQLLEPRVEGLSEKENPNDLLIYSPIVIGKLENFCLDYVLIEPQKYNRIRLESINLDQKWNGAPFASTLRRHEIPGPDAQPNILFAVIILDSDDFGVKQVKYSSILLQPIDLNLDEETLMKLVPFWRKSLSQSSQSQQYYFDHFEIHPIKIIANFLPAESYSSYNSTQEALRSLLHCVIQIPTIKNMVVELNGVLVTHALVTFSELLIKCAQHYSWYAMRAIYIAKGSPLLPPSFTSIFDDLASSSLDVFFDPSKSLLNVRGLTLGSFKLISKCIEAKGISGTKRYFGDLGKTLRTAGSNILFAAVTEVSDSVLKGAEGSGFSGMITGFHHGILKLAMEPTLLRSAFMEGGPNRKIKLDRSPGVDELYVEGYLQAMLDTVYKQEYLRVRVIDNQVILKNLPPNSSLIDEIMDRVKDFLVSKALLKGDASSSSRPLRHLRGENDWRIGPTILTLCEHLFVSFAIRMLRKQTDNAVSKIKVKGKLLNDQHECSTSDKDETRLVVLRRGVGRFALSAIVAYIDGRLCRGIPNPVARRIVSGFLLSFLDGKAT